MENKQFQGGGGAERNYLLEGKGLIINRGFTLAEVLITLGIIGIVSALTLPAVLAKAEKIILKNQFKKTYSMLSQAIDKSVVQYGARPDCYYGLNNNYADSVNLAICSDFTENYLLKNLKIIKKCPEKSFENGCIPKYKGADDIKKEENPDMTDEELQNEMSGVSGLKQQNILNRSEAYVLSDGSVLVSYGTFLHPSLFMVDINGKKGPNKWGYDLFILQGKSAKNIDKLILYINGMVIEKGGMDTKELLLK